MLFTLIAAVLFAGSFVAGYASAHQGQRELLKKWEREVLYTRALWNAQAETIANLEQELSLTAKKLHLARCWRGS